MGIFVTRHLNAVAGTANDDATRVLALVDSRSDRMSIVRIIHTVATIGSEILYLEAFCFEMFLYNFLKFKTRMVRSDRKNIIPVVVRSTVTVRLSTLTMRSIIICHDVC